MADISMRPDELRLKAKELDSLRLRHLEIMKQLRLLVMNLSEDWKGEAQEAFKQSFLNQNKKLNDLAKVLKDYENLMIKAADETENMDKELYSRIARIFGSEFVGLDMPGIFKDKP